MQVLKIDFSRPWVPQPVRAMQGDAGTRFVAFDLYDGGADYEIPGGASFTVGYQLRGGFEGAYDTITEPGGGSHEAVTASGNRLTVELGEVLTVDSNTGFFTVLIESADGKKLHTWAVPLEVGPSSGAAATDPGLDALGQLTTGAAAKAQAAQQAAEKAADSASESAANAEKAAQSAQNAQKAAEAAKSDAEASKSEASQSAAQARTQASAAETSAQTASTAETAALKSAEVSIANELAARYSAADAIRSEKAALEYREQAKEFATQAAGYAGAATYAFGPDETGRFSFFMREDDE